MRFLAPASVLLPFLAAGLLMLVGREGRFRVRLAAAAALLTALLSAGAAIQAFGHSHSAWFGFLLPVEQKPLGLTLFISMPGAVLAGLAAGLALFALLYERGRQAREATSFHGLALLFLGAVAGACLAGNLFGLFLFLELAGLAAYGLIGGRIDSRETAGEAVDFYGLSSLGGLLFLGGIGLVYLEAGSFDLEQAGLAAAAGRLDIPDGLPLALVTAGLLVKAANAPFPFRFGGSGSGVSVPVMVLLSGGLPAVGMFALVRLRAMVFPAVPAPWPGVLLGAFVLGGYAVLLRKKRTLANGGASRHNDGHAGKGNADGLACPVRQTPM